MNTGNVRQTENKLFVLGKVKSKKIKQETDAERGLYIAGQIVVATDTVLGKGETKIEFKQFAKKKDGSDNGLYKGLETVAREYKDADTFGIDNADLIKVEGELGDGTYYSAKASRFVEAIRVKGTFFNRLDTEQEHCCKAGFEGYISEIKTIEGGDLEVTIIGIGYEGVAVPMKGIVDSKMAIDFMNYYKVGQTATLNFAIINEVIIEQVQESVGFGQGLGEVIEKHIKKNIIFGGSTVNTQNPISEETVRQALAIREAKLEENKERAIKKMNEGASMNTGFGGAPVGAPTQNGFGAPVGFGTGNAGMGAPAQNGFGTVNSQNGFGAPAQNEMAPAQNNQQVANNGFGVATGGFGIPS